MKQIKCPICNHINIFVTADDLEKEIIDKSVHFYRHEEVGALMVQEILKRLKYPSNIIDAVVKGVGEHMRLKSSGPEGKDISDKALRKLRNDLGPHLDSILDVMHSDNISHSDSSSMPNQIPNIRKRLEKLSDIPIQKHIKLPIDGNKIMQLTGLKPGRELGDLKKKLEDAYLENPKMTDQEAIDFILDIYRK